MRVKEEGRGEGDVGLNMKPRQRLKSVLVVCVDLDLKLSGHLVTAEHCGRLCNMMPGVGRYA